MKILQCVLICALLFVQTEPARILAVFPTPLTTHQSVLRSIIHELCYRGHEVVLITPLPEYPRDVSPDNVMEIDVSEVTKEVWQEMQTGDSEFGNVDLKHILQVAAILVEKQLKVPEVNSFIRNNETFDLLLLEAWIRPTLFWTYIYDAPVVSISSFGSVLNDYSNLGSFSHPMLYPTSFQREAWNLNIWQKIVALYDYWKMNSMYNALEKEEEVIVRRLFGDVPSLRQQMEKIEMILLNTHPVWEGTRPVPKNVVHLGATHLQDKDFKTEMTEELKLYLDSSTHGVIFVNLGSNYTNIHPWKIPEQTLRMMTSAFGKLRFDVLWKSEDQVQNLPDNVKVGKWFPQAELLKHPKILLFISDCGQQSTDEAIAAEVPILGLPRAAEQWRNAEQLLRHNVGTVVNLQETDDETFKDVIELAIKSESYRNNMHHLRKLIFDMHAPAPVRAVDALEYVLRHNGGHLVSPTTHIRWSQYFEIELLIMVNISLCVSSFLFYKVLYFVFNMIVMRYTQRRVIIKDDFKSLL